MTFSRSDTLPIAALASALLARLASSESVAEID